LLARLVSDRLCVGDAHVFVGGNLIVGSAEGFGGKLMRTVSFLRRFFASSSSSPKRSLQSARVEAAVAVCSTLAAALAFARETYLRRFR